MRAERVPIEVVAELRIESEAIAVDGYHPHQSGKLALNVGSAAQQVNCATKVTWLNAGSALLGWYAVAKQISGWNLGLHDRGQVQCFRHNYDPL